MFDNIFVDILDVKSNCQQSRKFKQRLWALKDRTTIARQLSRTTWVSEQCEIFYYNYFFVCDLCNFFILLFRWP